MSARTSALPARLLFGLGAILLVSIGTAVLVALFSFFNSNAPLAPSALSSLKYRPRKPLETSGITAVDAQIAYPPDASLEEIANQWYRVGHRKIERLDSFLGQIRGDEEKITPLLVKALMLNYEGEPKQAYAVLEQMRSLVEGNSSLAEQWLYTIVYYQGVTAMRIGENENCVLCQGESACIFPILPSAIHTRPSGSRLAIQHWNEYLRQFPEDLEIRWLLSLAHMTIGEDLGQLNSRFQISLDHYRHSEFDIGTFRDISHLVGINSRLNMAGGAVMDAFGKDGLLDLVVTSSDPTQSMAFYRNKGDGTFEDRTQAAGLMNQLGGLNCVQADYNNDGRLDLFISRGGWLKAPMRPSLLRNNGDGTFTDVTKESGLLHAVNSNGAAWADFDNDGFLDLFLCCEGQSSCLYRNRGDGTFEDITTAAGLHWNGKKICKGCTWIDYDNDGYPDLFLNFWDGPAQLFHNNHDGTFSDVTKEMGIDGPVNGFSCWAFDYNNDGYLDIFATCYERTLTDIIKGLEGKPHALHSNRLYRNMGGKGFKDVTKEVGLDMVFAAMGSNFGDFDNDGYLDFYLGTGEPNFATLVPNRMFKNVAGQRFAEISASSRTGHLQKGHGIACGDWKRDGTIDIFVEMGGAVPGDKYHNVLYQNPGQGNNWLTVKLVGQKTNRSAIGARIKVVTAAKTPLTVHRHVSSGSSFGGNPLQQTIGLAKAAGVATLEIEWPTSGTKQVFHDLDVNQAIEITEFDTIYRKLDWKPIAVPK